MAKLNIAASKFVVDFLQSNKDNDNDTILGNWQSKKNQKEFQKNIKKEKKIKDLTKPKRSRSAYLLFSQDFRDQMIKENPNVPNKVIITKLANLWKEKKISDPDLVKKYEGISDTDKIRYSNEMQIYNKKTVASLETLTDNVEPENVKEEINEKKEDDFDDEEYEKSNVKSEDDLRNDSDNEGVHGEDAESDTESGEESEEESSDDSEYENNLNEIKTFHIFMEKKGKKLKKLYPELSSKEIKDNLTRTWNKLTLREKGKFMEKYL